jgi:hypothetical protein
VWSAVSVSRWRAAALVLALLAASTNANACCIGTYLALDPQTAQSLLDLSDEQLLIRVSALSKTISGLNKLDIDESWDAMHRALTNGKLEKSPKQHPPTSYTVLGGESLLDGDDWIVILITADQVRAAAAAIQPITRQEFHARYDRIDAASYDVPLSEDDFAYTWQNLVDVKSAFARWAKDAKWVLFVAAQ